MLGADAMLDAEAALGDTSRISGLDEWRGRSVAGAMCTKALQCRGRAVARIQGRGRSACHVGPVRCALFSNRLPIHASFTLIGKVWSALRVGVSRRPGSCFIPQHRRRARGTGARKGADEARGVRLLGLRPRLAVTYSGTRKGARVFSCADVEPRALRGRGYGGPARIVMVRCWTPQSSACEPASQTSTVASLIQVPMSAA